MRSRERQNKLELYELLKKQAEDIKLKKAELAKADPFWSFVPTDGRIPEDKRAVLLKYIKPEHIPEKVDCQKDVLLGEVGIKGVSGGNRAGKTLVDTIDGIIKSTGELPFSLEPYRDRLKKVLERAKSKVVRGRVVAIDYKLLYRVPIECWKQWVPRQYVACGAGRGCRLNLPPGRSSVFLWLS